MGMNWEIDYEPTGHEIPDIPVGEIVTVTSIEEIPFIRKESKSRLYLLPRLDKSKYMRRNLTKTHREFYDQIMAMFPTGKLFPYKTIREKFPQLDQLSVSQRLHILWVNGFSDKYVMGRYMRGVRDMKNRVRINGTYWGVHYVFYSERQI